MFHSIKYNTRFTRTTNSSYGPYVYILLINIKWLKFCNNWNDHIWNTRVYWSWLQDFVVFVNTTCLQIYNQIIPPKPGRTYVTKTFEWWDEMLYLSSSYASKWVDFSLKIIKSLWALASPKRSDPGHVCRPVPWQHSWCSAQVAAPSAGSSIDDSHAATGRTFNKQNNIQLPTTDFCLTAFIDFKLFCLKLYFYIVIYLFLFILVYLFILAYFIIYISLFILAYLFN